MKKKKTIKKRRLNNLRFFYEACLLLSNIFLPNHPRIPPPATAPAISHLFVFGTSLITSLISVTTSFFPAFVIDVLVVDSVAALVPEAELNGDMGDSHVGLHARLMSQAMRKLSGIISKTKCVAIFINQIREKVGVMFGNPETTTGGRALKFYSSVRLEIRRGEQIKDGTSAIGNRTTIKVVKNKVAPPFRTCEVEIIYGQGISHLGEIVDLATEMGLIEKSGSWFSYNGEKIGQGREKVKDYLKNHEDICNEIEAKIREA